MSFSASLEVVHFQDVQTILLDMTTLNIIWAPEKCTISRGITGQVFRGSKNRVIIDKYFFSLVIHLMLHL